MTPTQAVLYYIEYVAHKRRVVRTAAVQKVLEIVEGTAPSFVAEVHAANSAEFAAFALERIVQSLINNLERFEVSDSGPDSFNFAASLVLLHLGGPYVDPAVPILQVMLRNPLLNLATHEVLVSVLLGSGPGGIRALIELAQDEGYSGNARLMLNGLASHPPIVQNVIIPELVRLVNSSLPASTQAVAIIALSKLDGGAAAALDALESTLVTGSIDRALVAQALRTGGQEGEDRLVGLLARSRNANVRIAAVGGLGLPRYLPSPHGPAPSQTLQVCVEEDMARAATKGPHDPQYVYILPPDASPAVSTRADGTELPTDSEERLVLDGRELVASIRRALVRGVFDDPTASHVAAIASASRLRSVLDRAREPEQMVEDAYIRLDHSEDALVALQHGLCDIEPGVRMAAARALISVGLPGAESLVPTLEGLLRDSEAIVRETAAEVVGLLAKDTVLSSAGYLVYPLRELLKDEFWKVRYSAAKALGRMGLVAASAVKDLVDVLVSGTVTRNLASAALARIGDPGVEALRPLLFYQHMPNTQVRVAVAYGLRNMAPTSENIDYTVRDMFAAGKDPMPLVRCTVLESLALLGAAADEMVPYLVGKSLAPFLFSFLNDDAGDVRRKAAQALADFGPQGELLLVEGVLKDPSPRVRAASAYGLGILGPHTTRTLLLALNDRAPGVARSASRALLAIGVDDIAASLASRPKPARDSIAVSAHELLVARRKRPFPPPLLSLLSDLITALDHAPVTEEDRSYYV